MKKVKEVCKRILIVVLSIVGGIVASFAVLMKRPFRTAAILLPMRMP